MRTNPAALAAKARQLMADSKYEDLCRLVEGMNGADLAHVIERLEPEAGAKVFGVAEAGVAAKALEEMNVAAQRGVVARTLADRLAPVVSAMPDDDVMALLDGLTDFHARRVRGVICQERLDAVARLARYPRGRAGRMMSDKFVSVEPGLTAGEALGRVRLLAPEAVTANYVYVVDAGRKVKAVVSLRELVTADPNKAVLSLSTKDLITVGPYETSETAVRVAMDYDLLALPVVDSEETMLGIVTIDDLLDVLDEEAARSLQSVIGGGDAHGMAVSAAASPWTRLRQRLPWLVLLMFGDFLSANVIQRFEHVLQAVVAVAFFVPILLDMAGNVGTQSLAITIRGMATRRVGPRDFGRLVARETSTGLLLGGACGAIVAVLALVWQRSPLLGVVVGGAMFTGLTVAAILGVVVPVILDRLGLDAAVGSSPLITTAADVTALVIYFLLATRWLAGLM